MKTSELDQLKAKLVELTKKYGLTATPEQQQEVISLGKKIEEIEARNRTN